MINTCLTIGCLFEVIRDVYKQDEHDAKFRKWLAWGHGKSFEEYWGEDYAG